MLKLMKRPKPTWYPVNLGESVLLQVKLTAPNFEQIIADKTAPLFKHQVAMRLARITEWSGVVTTNEAGEDVDVPFSPEALGDLVATYPSALNALLDVIRPLYERGQTEDEQKKSAAPPAEAISEIEPSTAMPS